MQVLVIVYKEPIFFLNDPVSAGVILPPFIFFLFFRGLFFLFLHHWLFALFNFRFGDLFSFRFRSWCNCFGSLRSFGQFRMLYDKKFFVAVRCVHFKNLFFIWHHFWFQMATECRFGLNFTLRPNTGHHLGLKARLATHQFLL